MIYTKHNLTDTIVALATPPGVGAIGVIRLSGTDAISIADAVFHGKKLAKQPARHPNRPPRPLPGRRRAAGRREVPASVALIRLVKAIASLASRLTTQRLNDR